ncbi:MAG: hypothetical protein ACRDTG_29115 [Pseudonocardiaceae bacterium]
MTRRRPKSKAARGLETWRIVYLDRRSHAPRQEIKVDVRRGEVIDEDYTAAMVAARTTTALSDVVIVKVICPHATPIPSCCAVSTPEPPGAFRDR